MAVWGQAWRNERLERPQKDPPLGSFSPDHQEDPGKLLSQEFSQASRRPPVTCCLVLETHVSSSKSRRERWKALVVFTAMKMSSSCSSRDPGFCWFNLSVSCAIRRDKLEWYRRDRSPTHRRVKRAPARPRKARQCIGTGSPDSSTPDSPISLEWEAGQAGALVWAKVWQASGAGTDGKEGSWVSRLRAEPPLSRQPPAGRGHKPATCSSALPPGRAAWLLAPPLLQSEGRS